MPRAARVELLSLKANRKNCPKLLSNWTIFFVNIRTQQKSVGRESWTGLKLGKFNPNLVNL